MVKKIVKKSKKPEKESDEVSVITEAVYLQTGVFKYTVNSNKNLKLGLCNISD